MKLELKCETTPTGVAVEWWRDDKLKEKRVFEYEGQETEKEALVRTLSETALGFAQALMMH